MEILPIESLSDFEKDIYGANLYNLSLLKRLGFSVPAGIIIYPPEIVLQTVLRHLEDNKREIFEANLTLIKSEIAKIPIPQELFDKLQKQSYYFLNGSIYEKKEALWLKLLEIWLDEIRNKIWNTGLGEGITVNLSSQVIFWIKDKFETAKAFFDPLREDVVIATDSKLSPSTLNKIDKVVTEGNKKLFLPQIYSFVIFNEEAKIIALKPFTQSLPLSKTEDIILPENKQKKIIRSAIKLFLNLSSGFAIDPQVDGLLIEGEHSKDFDELVFKLSEGALINSEKPVLFKLPDVDEGELRGTMRLLHKKNLLESACNAFLFVRNKKNLLNIELFIPRVRSLAEFLEIKRELASQGISRKGSMKLGLEMLVPENIINIEDYLESGLDTILFDLDVLQKTLCDNHDDQSDLIKEHVRTLIKFITPAFSACHKSKVPIIVKGSVVLHPEVLDFLVEKGVWGVVANTLAETSSLPEHLHWVENRIIQKRLS
ncbi:MAG: hypothetical protein WCV81_02495 [Microgenomates group bacterium]|jgi:hypothetical protein